MKFVAILLFLSSCVTIVKCNSLSAKKQEYLAMYVRGDISFKEYEDLAQSENIINEMKELVK